MAARHPMPRILHRLPFYDAVSSVEVPRQSLRRLLRRCVYHLAFEENMGNELAGHRGEFGGPFLGMIRIYGNAKLQGVALKLVDAQQRPRRRRAQRGLRSRAEHRQGRARKPKVTTTQARLECQGLWRPSLQELCRAPRFTRVFQAFQPWQTRWQCGKGDLSRAHDNAFKPRRTRR